MRAHWHFEPWDFEQWASERLRDSALAAFRFELARLRASHGQNSRCEWNEWEKGAFVQRLDVSILNGMRR